MFWMFQIFLVALFAFYYFYLMLIAKDAQHDGSFKMRTEAQ